MAGVERRTHREVVRPAVSVRCRDIGGAGLTHAVFIRMCGSEALSGTGSRSASSKRERRMRGALLRGGVERVAVGCTISAWVVLAWLVSSSGVSEKHFGLVMSDVGAAVAAREEFSILVETWLLPRGSGPPLHRT